ncbi:hypothetical protein CBM2599_B20136 [Cupriavidus taiwanensis]|uniref:Uncharacterized protein n=1 Tax=Cupriavidus neocaledonicus TaxID=1040979 RepID=A0A375HRZ3_9BURK|nr:hypothetical protein CBM2599_B20136 [Cupriavidus taiwanensis]SOY98598.1 hypothetical protein CBM2600_B30132 [Cupriavidus taiwanensis]SOZ39731.1 hypothetical protein CBM2605_B40062 [Cupriavidus neocaledonicus]SPD60939.1 protein of unknown function [Cupriavidus neocaledonicus]
MKRPKVELRPLDLRLAVDALQTLKGLARSFAVWAWRDIRLRGIRYDLPEVPQTVGPAARCLHVGKEWDDIAALAEWSGLRNPYVESFTADRLRSCHAGEGQGAGGLGVACRSTVLRRCRGGVADCPDRV